MNAVTLNGVDSTTVKGLLISSLPPISKPQIRTEVEEIDGRDGDIVTKLGYAAYDKEITIGLYGDYDVDDVISFFNSEGQVTFSNEPDKYYNYTIVEQIDFERLLRFKKATVTFHVQPFKYSTGETDLVFTNPENSVSVTNTGNTVAKPTIRILGSGTINLSVNGSQLFVIELGDTEFITIDAASMNAYQGTALANRLVTGDYSSLIFPIGTNVITWTGTITEIQISNYSRWI